MGEDLGLSVYNIIIQLSFSWEREQTSGTEILSWVGKRVGEFHNR